MKEVIVKREHHKEIHTLHCDRSVCPTNGQGAVVTMTAFLCYTQPVR